MGAFTDTAKSQQIPVQIEQIRDDQKMFSYGSWLTGHELVLTSPVIVVISGESGVIPDGDYLAFATTGDIIVGDPDAATASLVQAGVARYVQGFRLKGQEAAERHRTVAREFDMQVFNLLAAIAVLLITGLSVSIIYSRKNAQMLFVKFISGWDFLSTYRSILQVEAGILLGLVALTWWQASSALAELTHPMAPPRDPLELYGLFELKRG